MIVASVGTSTGILAALQQSAAPAPWPAAAVHDSVNAIANNSVYARTVGTALWSRAFLLLADLWQFLASSLHDSAIFRAVIVTLLVALGVLVVLRLSIAARARDDVRDANRGGDRANAADPWALAESLATAGRFTDAAHALCAALLSSFAARGDVRLHASKTTGDYARELRQRQATASVPFSAFRRDYDRIIYGARECSAAEYAALERAALPMRNGSSAS